MEVLFEPQTDSAQQALLQESFLQTSFAPTDLAVGPWHDSTLHGGAPAGLLAYAFETFLDDNTLQPAKLSIDLLKPVPKSPLRIEIRPVRKGKRIALLEADLFAQETLLAKASELFVRPTEVPLPDYAPAITHELAGPAEFEEKNFADILFKAGEGVPAGLHTTVRLRPVSGLQEQGRGCAWMSLPVPVIAGQSTSPFVLASTLSDFGNGVGQLSLAKGIGTINSDVHLQLSRLPQSQWLALQSETVMQPNGIGQANTHMFDEFGYVGQVSQVVMPMAGFLA